MNTINAILVPEADGTLRLPLPEELKHGKVKVVATLEPANGSKPARRAGTLKGFWVAPDFDAPLDDFKEFME